MFHVTPCLPSAGRDAVTHGLGDAARIDVVINHPVQVHFELDSEFHVAIPRQTSLRQRAAEFRSLVRKDAHQLFRAGARAEH